MTEDNEKEINVRLAIVSIIAPAFVNSEADTLVKAAATIAKFVLEGTVPNDN